MVRRAISRSCGYLLIVGLIIAVVGCSATQPKGYEGDIVDRSHSSLVVGAHKDSFVPQQIELTSVDGQQEIARWKAPTPAVRLLPGPHEIGVKHVYEPPGFLSSMPGSAVHAVQDVTSDSSARILRLDLEPGFAYAVYVRRDPLQYFVSRFPNSSSLHPAWNPPASAVQCLPQGKRADVLDCSFATASAEVR